MGASPEILSQRAGLPVLSEVGSQPGQGDLFPAHQVQPQKQRMSQAANTASSCQGAAGEFAHISDGSPTQ